MKKFSQKLAESKTVDSLREALTLMCFNGIKPMRFVEWFSTEAVVLESSGMKNATTVWLRDELLLSEEDSWWDSVKRGAGYGAATGLALGPGVVPGAVFGAGAGLAKHMWDKFNKPGQQAPAQPAQAVDPIEKAHADVEAAIANLQKRMGSSKELQAKFSDPAFGKLLQDMSTALKMNLNQIKAGPAKTEPEAAPAPAPKEDPMMSRMPKVDPMAQKMAMAAELQRLRNKPSPAPAPSPSPAAPGSMYDGMTGESKNPYIEMSRRSTATMTLRNQIQSDLLDLNEYGYAPHVVLQSYLACEGLGDWLRGAVDKVKGFFGGGAQGGAQSDQAAIQDVMVKLDALEKQLAAAGHKPIADFAKHAQVLKQQLSGAPAAAPAPEAPQEKPNPLAAMGQKGDPNMLKLGRDAEMQRLKNKPSPYGTPGYKPPEGFAPKQPTTSPSPTAAPAFTPRGMRKESRRSKKTISEQTKRSDKAFMESVFGKKDKKGNWFSY